MRVTHLAPEADRSLAARVPQHASAFRTGKARWLAVALRTLVVVVVDRDDAELAIELIGLVAAPRERFRSRLRAHRFARETSEQRTEHLHSGYVVHLDFGQRTRGHARY